MSDLLASNRTHTGQVTDSESSINDSDYETLITSLLSKAHSPSHTVSQKKVVSDPIPSDNDSISQQVKNLQILSQLQSLGKRLDGIEAKIVKRPVIKVK